MPTLLTRTPIDPSFANDAAVATDAYYSSEVKDPELVILGLMQNQPATKVTMTLLGVAARLLVRLNDVDPLPEHDRGLYVAAMSLDHDIDAFDRAAYIVDVLLSDMRLPPGPSEDPARDATRDLFLLARLVMGMSMILSSHAPDPSQALRDLRLG